MRLCLIAPEPRPQGGGSLMLAGLIPALRGLGHTTETAAGPLPGAVPLVDGMVLPSLEPELETLVAADAIALVHHLGAAGGRDPACRERVRGIERRMLRRLRRVVATSQPVAERLACEMEVTATVITPGLPHLPRVRPAAGGPCAIVSFGVLTPRKGHETLLRALGRLTDLDWTLTIAGDAGRDPACAARLPPLIEALGLGRRVTLVADPAPEALAAAWDGAALFALASTWEGWPQGAAEALRRGVPVVATAVGGLPALVPSAAGLLVAPGDEATFGKVLRRAIFDQPLRESLAEHAWRAGCALPGWPQQALLFDAVLRS